MGTTNLDTLELAGTLSVTGEITPPATQVVPTAFEETVAYSAFTDGGGAAGTYEMSGSIPVGATFLFAAVTAVTGFAGDTSAVMVIGDGTDADRYNTGAPSVFATAANGVAMGSPSGVLYHDTAVSPTLTVTSGADFGSVTAGSVTVKMYYLA